MADRTPDAPLTVVTWLWAGRAFDWTHVQLLQRQVARWYPFPFRFLCVTNVPGCAAGVERIQDVEDFGWLPSPHGVRYPSCYRRLRMFRPDIGAVFGARFVSLDLDVVLTGDVTPLWHRPEPIVLLKDSGKRGGYNGSMVLMSAGARPEVWTRFDAMTSPQQAILAGRFGSDQGWISYVLGDNEACWTRADGVYSYRNELTDGSLPPDARMVVFHGADVKPWLPHMRRIEWVAQAHS